MKTIIFFMCIIPFICFGISFNVTNEGNFSSKSESKKGIFADKTCNRAFKLTVGLTNSNDKRKLTAYATTIYKANNKYKETFILDKISKIEIDPTKNNAYIFYTSKTNATDDNWKDVICDMSKGMIIAGCMITIVDENNKVLFQWSNIRPRFGNGFNFMRKDKISLHYMKDDYWNRYIVKNGTWFLGEECSLNDLPLFK